MNPASWDVLRLFLDIYICVCMCVCGTTMLKYTLYWKYTNWDALQLVHVNAAKTNKLYKVPDAAELLPLNRWMTETRIRLTKYLLHTTLQPLSILKIVCYCFMSIVDSVAVIALSIIVYFPHCCKKWWNVLAVQDLICCIGIRWIGDALATKCKVSCKHMNTSIGMCKVLDAACVRNVN